MSDILFSDAMLAVSSDDVSAMRAMIEAQLDERDAFERTKAKNSGDTSTDMQKARKAFLATDNVARLLVALNVSPAFINRSVSEGSRFNAKALKKISSLANYMLRVGKLEDVMKFFLLSALNISKHSDTFENRYQECALSGSHSFEGADSKILKSLKRHKSMSGGSATQASQARNVCEVLALADRVKDANGKDAISVNTSHALLVEFAARENAKK